MNESSCVESGLWKGTTALLCKAKPKEPLLPGRRGVRVRGESGRIKGPSIVCIVRPLEKDQGSSPPSHKIGHGSNLG